MGKLTKRVADSAKPRARDYFIWDDELSGLGLRVYASGKRSYVFQYRFTGGTRRLTIGLHGFWTPELARQRARVLFAKVVNGEDPAEQRRFDHQAMTVKELCDVYLEDLNAGLIMGKRGQPKKATTIASDIGRIRRHIVPLIGARRVKDVTRADINRVLNAILAGKTKRTTKTDKLRGKSIVRGGAGAATRTVGLFGGILTYAVENGVIEANPARGIRRPKDNVRTRRLSDVEYRALGSVLRDASKIDKYKMSVEIIRQLALTGCRKSEMVSLQWAEVDFQGSCLRLQNSKEGASVRAIGLPVIKGFEEREANASTSYVFPGRSKDSAFGFSKPLGNDFTGHSAIGPHAARPSA